MEGLGLGGRLHMKSIAAVFILLCWFILYKNFGQNGEDKPVKSHIITKKRFKILFWTDWYGSVAENVKEFYKQECGNDFVITSDKSQYDRADAVIFQYVDLKRHSVLPSYRYASVPWILSVQEAPATRIMFDNPTEKFYKKYNGQFNWTWSFRTDSEIKSGFVDMLLKNDNLDENWFVGSNFSTEFISKKTKLAAWVVSNCEIQPSQRNEFVEELKRHGVQVDIYGRCGNQTCDKGVTCFEEIGDTYKFYMALENSLCVDYITEKLSHGLIHNMVPIVYALGNIEKKVPPNSYIDALEFSTVADLAEKLKFLNENPKEYFKYFEWRSVYNVSSVNSAHNHCYTWRQIQRLVWKTLYDNRNRHAYNDIRTWFNQFYNDELKMNCEICLSKSDVNVTHLRMNKITVFNNSARCS